MNPKHIALILDGNRRYAKKHGWKPWKGHERGAEVVDNLMDWAKELDIKGLTLFCFSLENFKRDKDEVDFLMKLFDKWFEKIKDDKRITDNQVKLRFIGRLHLFPKKTQELMNFLMNKTKNYENYIVNFAMGYSGRAEIIDTINILSNKGKKKIDEKDFADNLYLSSEPDMIIRTSGEKRLSGFLPWQGVYSELFFVDKLWPEFTKKDLKACIDEFTHRKRNFGK